MIIGEVPNNEEDYLGTPFVGAVGKLLNQMLKAINLKRQDIYITNIIPWRLNNQSPTNTEIIQCLPFIQKRIELINPNIILLLGSNPAKMILSTPHDITKLRSE